MLTSTRPLRIGVLCSRRAPGLLHLLERDPGRGRLFEIVRVISSETTSADVAACDARGVDVVTHSIAAFYQARTSSVYRDFVTRRAYDATTAALLSEREPDIVLLDGYLYLLTRPMLDAFAGRILNLHFSDLTIRTFDGRPTYVGIRAVRDAIAAGEADTCATVHLVDDEPDGGAPVVRSWPYPVAPVASQARAWNATDMLRAYAYAHQEWMIRSASGPLLSAALRLIARGHVDLDALAQRDPSSVLPWLVDERGRLTPPGAVRMSERLWRYQRASA